MPPAKPCSSLALTVDRPLHVSTVPEPVNNDLCGSLGHKWNLFKSQLTHIKWQGAVKVTATLHGGFLLFRIP